MSGSRQVGTDPLAWVNDYVDMLEELGVLRRAFREALDLIEDLLADPFVSYSLGVFGVTAVKRLSEWEDAYWENSAPIIAALGLTPRLPPTLARIIARVERERRAQALTTPQSKGVVSDL